MNRSNAACPSHAQLETLVEGLLPDHDIDTIVSHIETCDACERTIAELDLRSGGLIDELRYAWNCDPASLATSTNRIIAGTEVLTLPYQIRDYRIEEKIAAGGQGVVYRARHCKLDQEVAVKILPTSATGDNRQVQRFWRQCATHGKLRHESIIRATDAGEDSGVAYLVMDYVDGIDLLRLIRAIQRPLPIPDACELVCQAAKGLGHAHRQGIVHRDVKPSNIMLTFDGNVKVLDFGIATVKTNGNSDLTAFGQFLGTSRYAAPEQFADSHNVDERADIYSLGATLFMMLTNESPDPAQDTDPKTLVRAIVARYGNDAIPLASVVSEMLARDPSARPGSMDIVHQKLAVFAQGSDLPTLARRVKFADSKLQALGPPNGNTRRACPRWLFPAGLALSAFLMGVLFSYAVITIRDEDGKTVYRNKLREDDSLSIVPGSDDSGADRFVQQQRGVRLFLEPGQTIRDELFILEGQALSEGFAVAFVRTPDGKYHQESEPIRIIPGTKLPAIPIDFDALDLSGTHEIILAIFESLDTWPMSVPFDRLPQSLVKGTPLSFQAVNVDVQLPHREYRTARWVIEGGGAVKLHEYGDRFFSRIDELPETTFSVQYITVNRRTVTDEDIKKRLSKMRMLQVVCLACTHITDDGLRHLVANTSISSLLLQETRVTDAGINELCKLKRLDYLDLSWTDVTPEGLRKLKSVLPECGVDYHQKITK
jgi:serine/threonine protein kinase